MLDTYITMQLIKFNFFQPMVMYTARCFEKYGIYLINDEVEAICNRVMPENISIAFATLSNILQCSFHTMTARQMCTFISSPAEKFQIRVENE